LGEGAGYKYSIRSRYNNYQIDKTDPYGFFAELRPKTASIVANLDRYQWRDADWMTRRAEVNWLNTPLSIYEVHLGSWRRTPEGNWLTYRELADQLVSYVVDMGYTHIELLPISEHPFDGSWGYQTTGYFSPTSRFGPPEDFMYFIDQCHQHNIGVILDWVPAHFAKDGHALSYFDGTHLYEHADSRRGEHLDWGTYIFNYGRNEVRNFLLSSALFWLKKYHIDGFRVDAVTSMIYLNFSRNEGQWLPNEYGGTENLEAIAFLREFNQIIYKECPGAITVAEESTSWPMVSRPVYVGGLGFTFKWDMGWMHDTFEYLANDPVYRRWQHNKLTFSMLYAFNENFVLSLSHDEVVHLKGSLINKIPGDWWQKFATLRLLFGYQFTHPGKKLNFMGQEFGQWAEWSEARGLYWELLRWDTHAGVQRFMRDLNRMYKAEKSLWQQDIDWRGFKWINANDADNSTYAYIRIAEDPSDYLVVVMNFTPVPRPGCGNVGNMGSVEASPEAWGEFPATLSITVPPLGIVVFKPTRKHNG
jgi:1,4-alpha-glucan branching enzyme